MLHPPVDGIARITVAFVISVTGAVDDQSRLITVCVLVTAAVIL